jgi:hypothetical protein
MSFQIFLNLVGAGTILGKGSGKKCARARVSVAHALSLSLFSLNAKHSADRKVKKGQ